MVFSIENEYFEIDLADANRAMFYEALVPFMRAGRRIANPYIELPSAEEEYVSPSMPELREWARSVGIGNVSDKGRIPGELRLAHRQWTLYGRSTALDELLQSRYARKVRGTPGAAETPGTTVNKRTTRKSDKNERDSGETPQAI